MPGGMFESTAPQGVGDGDCGELGYGIHPLDKRVAIARPVAPRIAGLPL